VTPSLNEVDLSCWFLLVEQSAQILSYMINWWGTPQCLLRDGLVTPNVNKKWRHSEGRLAGEKWCNAGVSYQHKRATQPKKWTKQSNNLSICKHWYTLIFKGCKLYTQNVNEIDHKSQLIMLNNDSLTKTSLIQTDTFSFLLWIAQEYLTEGEGLAWLTSSLR